MMHRSLTERSKDFSFLNDSEEDSNNKIYKKKGRSVRAQNITQFPIMDSPL